MCEVLDSIPTLDGGTGPCNGLACSSMLVSSESMGQWEVSHLDMCSLLSVGLGVDRSSLGLASDALLG